MNRQQIALKLALADGDLEVSTATFEDRLVTQKVVYLLQKAGVHLGYPFQWYLRGPYSSDLSADIYSLAAESAPNRGEAETWKLDIKSRRRIGRLKTIWTNFQDIEDKARNLELIASVHFLIDQEPARMHDISGLRKILKRFKKLFSEPEIREAISTLRAHNLA
jgi:uncharacterized protein YwgA